MGFLTGETIVAVEASAQYRAPPPPGAKHSVAIPGSKKPGRSEVYRHWRFTENLLQTLDPAVCRAALVIAEPRKTDCTLDCYLPRLLRVNRCLTPSSPLFAG